MRVLIQRVLRSSVKIEGTIKDSINNGLLLFIGVEDNDNLEDVDYASKKIASLRIFDDNNGVMNLSIKDVGGELMVISQFTLHAQTKKGNRPSYIKAARPEKAIPIYESMIESLSLLLNKRVASGVFGADMEISLINDGPVTIWIDTKNRE